MAGLVRPTHNFLILVLYLTSIGKTKTSYSSLRQGILGMKSG